MPLVLTVQQDTSIEVSLNNGGAIQADPIDSSTFGGGGAPLAGQWFVGENQTPPAEQDGSLARPFSTFAQAIAAAGADRVTNPSDLAQVIWIQPFNYSGEPDQVLDLTVPTASLTLACWSPLMAGLPPAPSNVPLLPGLTMTVGDLILEGVCLGFASLVDVPNSIVSMRGSMVNSSLNASSLRAVDGCQIGGLVQVTNAALLVDTLLAGGGITCPVATFISCPQSAACAVVGTAIVDAYSNSFGTITATVALQVRSQQARETVSVVVPAVAAGQVQYVTTSFVGELAAIPIFAPIVGCPHLDLVPGGGIGGAFVGCSVDVIGSVRCVFLGPLAGGATDFTFAAL